LYYLQSRYYDPEIGKFISKDDPIFHESETGAAANLYAYCENNPVNNSDPMGYSPRWYHLAQAVYKIGKGLIALGTALAKGFVRSALGSIAARVIGFALGTGLAALPLGQWWATVINVAIIVTLVLRVKSLVYDLPMGLWHLKQFIKHDHK
jgi:hypothetical protein